MFIPWKWLIILIPWVITLALVLCIHRVISVVQNSHSCGNKLLLSLSFLLLLFYLLLPSIMTLLAPPLSTCRSFHSHIHSLQVSNLPLMTFQPLLSSIDQLPNSPFLTFDLLAPYLLTASPSLVQPFPYPLLSSLAPSPIVMTSHQGPHGHLQSKERAGLTCNWYWLVDGATGNLSQASRGAGG